MEIIIKEGWVVKHNKFSSKKKFLVLYSDYQFQYFKDQDKKSPSTKILVRSIEKKGAKQFVILSLLSEKKYIFTAVSVTEREAWISSYFFRNTGSNKKHSSFVESNDQVLRPVSPRTTNNTKHRSFSQPPPVRGPPLAPVYPQIITPSFQPFSIRTQNYSNQSQAPPTAFQSNSHLSSTPPQSRTVAPQSNVTPQPVQISAPRRSSNPPQPIASEPPVFLQPTQSFSSFQSNPPHPFVPQSYSSFPSTHIQPSFQPTLQPIPFQSSNPFQSTGFHSVPNQISSFQPRPTPLQSSNPFQTTETYVPHSYQPAPAQTPSFQPNSNPPFQPRPTPLQSSNPFQTTETYVPHSHQPAQIPSYSSSQSIQPHAPIQEFPFLFKNFGEVQVNSEEQSLNDSFWDNIVKPKKSLEFTCFICNEVQNSQDGIYCPSNHKMCADCTSSFLQSASSDGFSKFPLKCQSCDIELLFDVVRKNIKSDFIRNQFDQKELDHAITLSENEQWIECPACSYREIRDAANILLIFCKKCQKTHCHFCNKEVRDGDLDVHLRCEEFGAIKTDFEKAILTASTRSCPQCNLSGQKNYDCTHMKCPRCQCEWCYICGKSVDQLDKDPSNRSIYGHNANWNKMKNRRCPMYLHQISEIDKSWPDSDIEALDFFHQRLLLNALKEQVNKWGRDKVREFLTFFPAASSGFPLTVLLEPKTNLF